MQDVAEVKRSRDVNEIEGTIKLMVWSGDQTSQLIGLNIRVPSFQAPQ